MNLILFIIMKGSVMLLENLLIVLHGNIRIAYACWGTVCLYWMTVRKRTSSISVADTCPIPSPSIMKIITKAEDLTSSLRYGNLIVYFIYFCHSDDLIGRKYDEDLHSSQKMLTKNLAAASPAYIPGFSQVRQENELTSN